VPGCCGQTLDRVDGGGPKFGAGRTGAGKGGLVDTERATKAIQAVAVGHDHKQRSVIYERKLLAEESGVVLRLAPELGDRAQICGRGDHRDADLVSAAFCRGYEHSKLRLLADGDAGILRQKESLGCEDV
jgi:hypothetical protein